MSKQEVIQALLAKAEASESPAEAEAFYTKAMSLLPADRPRLDVSL